MENISVVRGNFQTNRGISKTDKSPISSKQQAESIALRDRDKADFKKPELILSKTSADLFEGALGSGYIKGEQRVSVRWGNTSD